MASSLLDKVWDAHTVRTLPSGQTQLLIGLHLIHEVTSPQAFQALRELGRRPLHIPSADNRKFVTQMRRMPRRRQIEFAASNMAAALAASGRPVTDRH